MRIIVFEQWDRLVALLKGIASGSATERTQYAINRVEVNDGVARPDIVPGKARDFMLRVTATGDNEIAFTGAEAFEGDAGSLEPPSDGETVVYFFTETDGDVMLVARKPVERLEP